MPASYINAKGETCAIQLSQEEKDVCGYSPIEMLLYYLVYPDQLLKDVTSLLLDN